MRLALALILCGCVPGPKLPTGGGGSAPPEGWQQECPRCVEDLYCRACGVLLREHDFLPALRPPAPLPEWN